MAGFANALQDPVSAVHHACRADALRVVRHERARGVAARIVRAIDAILYSEAAEAAEPHGCVWREGAGGLMDQQMHARFAVAQCIMIVPLCCRHKT